MPVHPLRLAEAAAARADAELVTTLAALRAELGLAESFPPEALAEAERAARATPLPERNLTGVPFVTIDPPGATDLDQALHLERDGAGMLARYAIADLPAFVPLGGAVDAEARSRGMTMYAADGRIPLHPVAVSEDAASLLPGRERGAFVWSFRLDAEGRVTETALERARVRSRRQLSYEEADAELAAGAGESLEVLRLLLELGEARRVLEAERGGASLNTPEVLVVREDDRYRLERRVLLPIETANAQLSLLTGMEAARLMLRGGVGVLRTMPPADEGSIARFRRRTRALGEPWPAQQRYGDYLRGLDGTDPRHLAILHAAASLFRGASYTVLDGTGPEVAPGDVVQAAIGAPYAHVTAPLRRLVDRFGLLVCEALVAGREPDAGLRAALAELPSAMGRAASTAGRLDRETLEAVEAAVLAPRAGEVFDAVVTTADEGGSEVQLTDPAVEARVAAALEPGSEVRVRLVSADVPARETVFEPA